MNIRFHRPTNSLRQSQNSTRGNSKENSGSNKYKALLQGLSRASRPPSQENRAFRNITNLYLCHGPARGPSEEGVLKKLQRFRNAVEGKDESKDSRLVSCSFTARPQGTSTTVVLFDSKKETERGKSDPQGCEEYAGEIDEYLKTIESKYAVNPDYMESQHDINKTMRAILVDWLVDVHIRFKLLPETLFLAVNLLDRYLAKELIKKEKLQLVGVTAALIACKYEEIYPPEVRDFIYITDNAYSKDDILKMEQKMLQALGFNLNIPSSNRFLLRFAKVFSSPKKTKCLAQYLLELSLVETGMIKYQPSMLAAAALYLSHKLHNGIEKWSERMAEFTGYSEKNLSPCAKEMIMMLQEVPKGSLQAVRKKFSTVKYMEVAQIKICKKP